jgi:hypothetical protein
MYGATAIRRLKDAIRPWPAAAAVSVLAFAVLLAPSLSDANVSPQSFCKRNEGKYVTAFKKMPPLHLLPASGKLPFASKSAYFSAFARPVVVGGGEIGYGFSPSDGKGMQGAGWTLKVRVVSINGRGHVVRSPPPIERLAQSDGDLGDLRLQLELSRQPALYKVELTFLNRAGHRLGKYGEYVRVVKPTVAVSLGLSGAAFSPGETAYMRVENLGTETVRSGPEFVLERLVDGRWTIDPDSPKDIWRKSMQVLFAGEGGRCQEFQIPVSQAAGQYRFSKVVLVRPTRLQRRIFTSFSVQD